MLKDEHGCPLPPTTDNVRWVQLVYGVPMLFVPKKRIVFRKVKR